MTEDVTAPTAPPAEPEWLEDLRDDLRRAADREHEATARPVPILERLLGRPAG